MAQLEKEMIHETSVYLHPDVINEQSRVTLQRYQRRQFIMSWIVMAVIIVSILMKGAPGVHLIDLWWLGLVAVAFNLLRLLPVLRRSPYCFASPAMELIFVSTLILKTGGLSSVLAPLFLIPILIAAPLFNSKGLLIIGCITIASFAATCVLVGNAPVNLIIVVFMALSLIIAYYLYREVQLAHEESADLAQNAQDIARLYEDAAARNREIYALQNTIRMVAETLNLPEVLSFVSREIVDTLRFDRSLLFLIDRQLGILKIAESHNVQMYRVKKLSIPIDHENIVAEVARQNQAQIVSCSDDSYSEICFDFFPENKGCCVFAPISLHGEVLGVVVAGSDKAVEGITEHEEKLMRSMLDHTAVAIGNARHFEEARRQMDHLRMLSSISSIITTTLDIKELMSSVVEVTSSLMNTEVCILRLLDGEDLVIAAQKGVLNETAIPQRIQTTQGVAGILVNTRAPLAIPDLRKDPRLDDNLLVAGNSNLRCYLGAPLIVHGELTGIMSLYGAEVHHFTEREIEIIRTIASQASVAISNALLYEQIAKARDELEAKVLERTHDLAETNEQLAAILSGISDGISVVDRDLKITWVNDVEAIRFGERGSLLGYHCQEIYRCAAESCGEYPAKITLDSGQIAKSILTAVLPDGETHYYEVITSPIYDVFTTGGEIHVAKVLQIARDITESRHMQDQIAEYTRKLENMVEDRTAELQRKNEELESFVFTVSHDLKAPIVSIQGFAANLAREYGPNLEGDGEFYLQRIRKNTEQLQSLIQELLELSRIGRLPEPWEMVDINELVADVGAELQFQLENNHINFIIEPNLPKAVCQRKRFRQVFVNLIDNAIRYRGTNENPFIKVSASDLGDVWEFCVQDSGVGIAPENKRKIFQIFQRLYKVPDAKDGAGVGLAIVKKIVETHGGLIRVESEGEGLGSSFIFTLPKREQIVSEEEA